MPPAIETDASGKPLIVTNPHKLNRAQMERIITHEKQSVLYKGRLITRVEDLPSEAQLAIEDSDPKAKEKAQEHLQSQIDALQAQLEGLQKGTLPPAPAANNPEPWKGQPGDPSLTPHLSPGSPVDDPAKAAKRQALLDDPVADAAHQPEPEPEPSGDTKPKGNGKKSNAAG